MGKGQSMGKTIRKKGPSGLPMVQELAMIRMAIKSKWEVPDDVRVQTVELLTQNINDEELDMKYRISSADLLAKIVSQQATLDLAVENLNMKMEQHQILKQFSDSNETSFSAIELTDEDIVSDKPQESLEG
jgi:hypothetical protein